MATGRPSSFTQKVADEICARISDGDSLRTICARKGMPAKSTVFKWLREIEGFSDQYARAKEEQADALFEEILGIADSSGEDADVQRDRLRVDARKWMAGKLRPKVYGDKIQNEHSGPDGGPIRFDKVEMTFVRPNSKARDS